MLFLGGAAGAVPVPGSGGRLAASGYLDGRAVAETEGGPEQRPQALLDLALEARIAGPLSTRLELRGRAGGPFAGGHPGPFNLNHQFQNYSPSFEAREAYLDLHLRQADVRAGVQTIAWGKLDGIPPTDVINPRDFHDPFVDDVEERKIGVPAVLGSYYLPDVPALALSALRTTLVYVPIAVPPRLALRQERWFPTSNVPPPAVVSRALVERALGVAPPRDLVIPIRVETGNHHPPRQLDAGGIGLRLGGTWREHDWDIYHYTGPETGPNAKARAEAVLASIDPLRVRARSFLRQTHAVIHMTGADAATTLAGVTLRAEAAHFADRPYLRLSRDLVAEALRPRTVARIGRELIARGRARVPLGDLFPTLDAVEWGIGADYLIRGFQPLLQVNQIVLLERAPRLLIGDPDTRLTGMLRRRFLAERLELEVRGVYGIEQEAWFVLPRASYRVRDDFRVRLGYLAVGGRRASLFGQFGENDEVVLQARYGF